MRTVRADVIQGFFPHGAPRTSVVPPHLAGAAAMGGQPLPPAVRQTMESFFGTSFADVRVHVGPQAPALGAVAFTRGANIHFAPGSYQPHTPRGREILGHELAHVVQQRAGRARNPFGRGVAVVHDAALEAEARRFAHAAAAQPLTYARFSGFFGRFKSFSDQERRMDALESRIADAIRDTKSYFATHRSWMGLPNALLSLEQQLRNLRARTHAQRDYDAVERELKELIQRFDDLSSGWAKVDKWTERHPKRELMKGIDVSHGAAYVDKKMFDLKNKSGLKIFIDLLFSRFINYGFRYDAQAGWGTGGGEASDDTPDFFDTDRRAVNYMQNPNTVERYGSCRTFASAFARLLKEYGIPAGVEQVVPENQLFLARVPAFIDPSVTSNVEYRGQKLSPYIVFSGHAATKVTGFNLYWDPMAKTTYQSIKPSIDCYLEQDETKHLPNKKWLNFKGTCKTLRVNGQTVSNSHFHLVGDTKRSVGGLTVYTLVHSS